MTDADRWPAGHPAAPISAFNWKDLESTCWAPLEKQSRARVAAAKAEVTKRRNRTSKATIYGLSRASDEQVLLQAAQRRVAR